MGSGMKGFEVRRFVFFVVFYGSCFDFNVFNLEWVWEVSLRVL